ncbi:MAG: hypothetical protein V1913_03605 [Fibrobacterota bacterium]
MLGLLRQAAKRIKVVLLPQTGRVFNALACGQGCGHASTGKGRPATIRNERGPFYFSISRGQPELHSVAARPGDARMPVETA